MSFQINISKILNSSNNIFDEILDKVAINNLKNARKELAVKDDLNGSLIEVIAFSLERLKSEESLFSQFLYSKFGIGETKNKRRTELIMLGGKLKNVIRSIKRQESRIEFHVDNLTTSIENLTRLAEAFGKNLHQLDDESMKMECEIYLKEIYLQIDKADNCKEEFALKKIYLESTLFKYNELLKQIPRYHELREERENYMLSN